MGLVTSKIFSEISTKFRTLTRADESTDRRTDGR